MVGDEDELSRDEIFADASAGIRQHDRPHAEATEHAHTEYDLRGREALVKVRAAAHDGERHAADRPERERPRVPERSRHGPARDLAVGDLDRGLQLVREPAEAAPEHHGNARLE